MCPEVETLGADPSRNEEAPNGQRAELGVSTAFIWDELATAKGGKGQARLRAVRYVRGK